VEIVIMCCTMCLITDVKWQRTFIIQWLYNKILITAWNHYNQKYIYIFISIKTFINRIK
jgi:hypothetical protein